MYEMPWHTQTQLDVLCAVVCSRYFHEEKNTLHSPCSYRVVASSSSCAQVSSTSVGFTSWLTVSITIIGMIGSFKSVLKSLVSYLVLPILLGSFQAECGNVLYWTFPPSWLLRFWICDWNPLALFWVIYTYEWRFMPESSMCLYYPIKLGCSVAPEIALKCNINAAILRILPLWNTQGPSDAIAACYDQGDLSI